MPDNPPPGVAQDVAGARPEALSAETIEHILADFRRWLQDIATRPADQSAILDGEFGLHDLVSQFVALRHDVNLQTKAARAQQEQASRSLEALEQALDHLEHADSGTHEETDEAAAETLRPLLKSVLEITDLMNVAGREVDRVRGAIKAHGEALSQARDHLAAMPASDHYTEPVAPATFLQRLFGRANSRPLVDESVEKHRRRVIDYLTERDNAFDHTCTKIVQLVESILAGYNMSLERLERTLAQFGLEPIPSEGHTFDPEMMEVVDIVTGTDLPSGQVVQEVRRGYRWRGRMFRYAQVKVAKS
jgi:molecular chaperone GrpE